MNQQHLAGFTCAPRRSTLPFLHPMFPGVSPHNGALSNLEWAASATWFEESFGEEYLTCYQHRDSAEASGLAQLIYANTPAISAQPVLDVGCGAGRHLPYLRRGGTTVGVDLSQTLLRQARAANPEVWLLRADMRALPFAASSFGLVVNLFTSFGYFPSDHDNKQVIAEIARVTASGGWFVLDFLNASRVRRTLLISDRKYVASRLVEQRRRISADGLYVEKAIAVAGVDRIFYERVRLYEPAELVNMLAESGFTIRQLFGDYQGNPWHPDSARALLITQKQ